ncbi:MAG: hypothetical protein AAF889_09155 [Cyanobacteria bacterium P01_D01_bin.73]
MPMRREVLNPMMQRSRVTFASGMAIGLATWLMASSAFAHYSPNGAITSASGVFHNHTYGDSVGWARK